MQRRHRGSDDNARGAKRWRLSRLLGIDRIALARMLLAFAIGALGAYVFTVLKAPLPVFLGALTFSIIASIAGAPVERPKMLGAPMRALLGVAVGAAFTPDLLGRMAGMAGSLLLLVPYTVLITIAGLVFFERLARYDRPTAFFASVPGGLTDMVTMSEEAGANQRAVTLIHATRITFLVFTVPFFVQLANGETIGGRMPNLVHLWDMRAVDGLTVLALIGVGWSVAKRAGLAGAPLVGPMLASGLVHAAGLTEAKVPLELLILAQVTLGILLGCQFRGLTLREFGSTMTWALLFSALLLAVTIVAAYAVAHVTGFDRVSVLLAFAPGGQTELNLLALILNLDVAYIALHHLVRLAIVIIGAQAIFLSATTWRK